MLFTVAELGFVKVIDDFFLYAALMVRAFFHKNLWLEMMLRLAGSQRFMFIFRAKQGYETQADHLRYTKPAAMGDSPICYRDLLPS